LERAVGYYKAQAAVAEARLEKAQLEVQVLANDLAQANANGDTLREQLETRSAELESLQEFCSDMAGESNTDQQTQCDAPEEHEYDDLRDMLNARRARQLSGQYRVPDAKQLQSIASKPVQFEGKSAHVAVRDWLCGLKEYIQLVAGAYAPEYQVKLAATFLKGDALRLWQTERVLLTAQQQGSWAAFEEVLLQRYDIGMDADTARFQLDRLTLAEFHGNVVDYVKAFDNLISYVPTMAEEEKVHRFQSALPPHVLRVLYLDSQTNERWKRYSALRAFALKQFSHQVRLAVSAAGAAPPTTHKSAGQLQGAARREAWQPGQKRRRDEQRKPPGKQHKQQQGTGASSSHVRSKAVKQFCFEKGLCKRCFKPGHVQANCTSEWVYGNPPGFSPPKPAGG
jgi:hypothetical protein